MLKGSQLILVDSVMGACPKNAPLNQTGALEFPQMLNYGSVRNLRNFKGFTFNFTSFFCYAFQYGNARRMTNGFAVMGK